MQTAELQNYETLTNVQNDKNEFWFDSKSSKQKEKKQKRNEKEIEMMKTVDRNYNDSNKQRNKT